MKNAGTLGLKYKVMVTPVSENGGINVNNANFKLSDYLVFGTTDPSVTPVTYADRTAARNAVGTAMGLDQATLTKAGRIEANRTEQYDYLALVVYMPETVGNEANAKPGTVAPSINLGITVVATQLEAEFDSFDNTYDEDAIYAPEYVAGAYYDYFEAVNVSDTADVNGNFTVTKRDDNSGIIASASGTAAAGAKVSMVITKTSTPTGNFGITVEEGHELNGYDIKVTGQTENSLVQGKLYVGTGLENFVFYHDGSAMTLGTLDSNGKVEENKYYYSLTDGFVYFATTTFSPFQATYKAPVAAINTAVYGTLADAVAAAKTNDTITLLKNVTASAQINLPAGVTLDGAGYAVKADNESWSTTNGSKMLLEIGANATVKNVTLDSNGQACGVQAYAVTGVKLENVTLKNSKNAGLLVNASQVAVSGKLAMSGNGWGNYINLGWGSGVTTTADKCTIEFAANAVLDGVTHVWTDADDLSNASVTQDTWSNKFAVSGTEMAPAKVDGGIAWIAPAAKIGTTTYATLTDAVAAAKSGETVVMLKDFVNADLANSVHFSLKNGVTLDGQGHAIRGNADLYMASAAGAVSTVKNVVFQYIHNGSMASQSDCDWYGWENGKQGTMSAIHIDSLQGTANIIDCTFDNADWDAIQITPKNGATINIIGNTFSHSSTTDYSQLRYIHIQNTSLGYSSTTVNVNDNKFYKTRDLDAASICNIGIWSVESSGLNLTGNYFEYNPSEQMIETNSEVPGGTKSLFPARSQANVDTDDLNPVSYIGDVAYLNSDITPAAYEYYGTTFATLQEAIDSNFTSIYLAKDNNESVTVPEGKAKQIDLKACKLNGTVINNGTLYFFRGTNTEGAAKITNNGTMTLNCNATTGYTVTNNGTLKITSGATYDLSKITNGENGQVIISGGTFTNKPQSDWIQFSYKAADNEDGTYSIVLKTAEEAVKAGAVARYDLATYYKTVQEGFREKNALHLIANASEDVTRAGSIDLYCEEYTFTGSLICPGMYLYIDNGTAILNRIECGTFYGGFRSYDATVTVKDGSATKIIVAKNANVTIEGGTYTGTIKMTSGGSGSLTIKGGTFASDPTAYVDAANYTVTDNGNGTWTVTANKNTTA